VNIKFHIVRSHKLCHVCMLNFIRTGSFYRTPFLWFFTEFSFFRNT
jgi:hypothetical protein